MKNLKYFILLSTQLFPNYLLGHHSFTAEFTAEKTIIIEGVIKEVWFRNPHVRYLLEVSNENETEIWDLRGSPVVWLARKGWRRDSINIGDQISVYGFPGHQEKKILSIIEVTLSDGSKLIDKAPS